MSNNPLKIGIEITQNAFLPEAYAYQEYFKTAGFICDLVEKGDRKISTYDVVFLFHGFHPFWKKYPKIIVGEYHSLSTGSFNRFKDLIKRIFNVKPNLYIFLNDDVRKKLWFSTKVNYLTRGMGYSGNNFSKLKTLNKNYDIVYCGSYRDGLLDVLGKLAKLGLTIAVIGFDKCCNNNNIKFFGRKKPAEARKIICQARFGLNYTPDIFPLNIQDSTKVIEYCAAGLGVITNKYRWINEFEKSRGGRFLDLNNIYSLSDIYTFNYIVPNVEDLEWSCLIQKIKLKDRIIELSQNN